MIHTTLALVAVLGAAAPSTPKEKFYVYGGGCSRSIQLRGTYTTIQAACVAAEKLRKEKQRFVTVRTGAHKKDYFGWNATQYKVYHKASEDSCRARFGWVLNKTVEKAKKAREIAEKLKKDGDSVEIVGHYVAK
jgi:hypothetical protein